MTCHVHVWTRLINGNYPPHIFHFHILRHGLDWAVNGCGYAGRAGWRCPLNPVKCTQAVMVSALWPLGKRLYVGTLDDRVEPNTQKQQMQQIDSCYPWLLRFSFRSGKHLTRESCGRKSCFQTPFSLRFFLNLGLVFWVRKYPWAEMKPLSVLGFCSRGLRQWQMQICKSCNEVVKYKFSRSVSLLQFGPFLHIKQLRS